MRRAALAVCGAILVASAAAAATRLRPPAPASREGASSAEPGAQGESVLSAHGAGDGGLAASVGGGSNAGLRPHGVDELRMAESGSPTQDSEPGDGTQSAGDSAFVGADAPGEGDSGASVPGAAEDASDTGGVPGAEVSKDASAGQPGSGPGTSAGEGSAGLSAAEEDSSAAEAAHASQPDPGAADAEGVAEGDAPANAESEGEGSAVADEASGRGAGSSAPNSVPSMWEDAADEVTVPLAMSPKRTSARVSVTYEQYDPNPAPSEQCPSLSVVRAVEKDPALPGQLHARDAARHVAAFASLWDEQAGDNRVAGQLYAPSRLPLARRGTHFLTGMDGRARFAVLGAPGGDLGQFATVLAAVEMLAMRMRQQGRPGRGAELLTDAQVEDALRGYVESNIGVRGAASPHKFAVCTDRAALQRWADHTGTESLRDPVDEGTRARALRGVDSAEHVGDSHLRAMLLHSEEYRVRRDLLAALLRTANGIVLNEKDALHGRMLHVVMEGYHEERGLVTVQTRCAECPSAEALVVPTVVDGGGSVKSTYFVLHPDAARAARHEFARVLARQFPEKVASAAELAAAADELAAHALDATLARVLDAKRSVSVDVTFADAITP